MNFWQFFWLLVWSFFFVAFLIALFQIVVDLFRDQELSGWWKALWLIFLLFAPVLGALVYLIARGNGMAKRQMRDATDAKQATDAYIQSVAKQSNPAEQIATAKGLLDSGAISQAEFDALKAKALT
ncbi:putative oligomerization/nucleic acid binding protein [Humibacillus xanthopallidus]|uniref:Putative oligomerization/nucleic acid binding protein n=1 Tax=Humibacillus xanthopallidus TaxID=412689 RepID=A0A543PY38_9MICO|nr:SHOCT domain-containing protein [Humibacillus xanthopallidus]TQN48993.1 putative oligomerization/nucleic acid binding protein [Humibacillus xanthopallidus]